MKFAILIDECEGLARIHGNETEDEYQRTLVDAVFKHFRSSVCKALVKANLGKPNFLRFKLDVHAQAVDE